MAGKVVADKNVRRKSNKFLKLGLILILVVSMVVVGIYSFSLTHFGRVTIQEVNCSWLSVEQAKERLEDSIGNTRVNFTLKSKNYIATYNELGVEVSTNTLEQMLKSQNFFKKNEFTLENGITVSKEKVRDFLSKVQERHGDSIVYPKDAYVRFDGEDFIIEKEVLGNQIDYDMASNIAEKAITGVNKNLSVDLTTAMKVPRVLSTDKSLIDNCNNLNKMLNANITIKLMDGSTYVLNKEYIKNWITYDEKDFSFKIEECVMEFVDKLSKAAKNITTVQFKGTGVGNVTMPAFEESIPKVIKEETVSFIMDKLKKGNSYIGKPIYDKDPITEKLTSYVEIDITRQRVFMYINGKLIVNTPTVTGNIGDGYYTPTGVFYLNNKVYDTVLRGFNKDGSKYASPVLYWMPFYKGYGMHDANWRSKFGGEIYKNNGSHGCVNLPANAAKTIYENITYDMPIFIYKS